MINIFQIPRIMNRPKSISRINQGVHLGKRLKNALNSWFEGYFIWGDPNMRTHRAKRELRTQASRANIVSISSSERYVTHILKQIMVSVSVTELTDVSLGQNGQPDLIYV